MNHLTPTKAVHSPWPARVRWLLSLVSLVLGLCQSASALTIIPTFDSSITTNANAASIMATIRYAIAVSGGRKVRRVALEK